jgi:hypothetical protein
MKTLITILGMLCLVFSANAQSKFTISDNLYYAVIKDTDGYVNIRKDASINAPIAGKINNYSVFSCEPNDKSNWWKVLQVYENDESWLVGYIYKDKVSLLPENWKLINEKNIHLDSCILKTDSVIIAVKRGPFNAQKHKLLYSKRGETEKGHSHLEKIDERLIWGTDGGLPKKSIKSIKITKSGIDVVIPKNAFSDLYEPNLKTLSICYGPENIFYIKMDNSDGAGAYTVIWAIKDNKYMNRYIDYSMR